MEINNEIMEIVSFEKRTFEEIAAKLDYFVQRMDDLCRQHGEKKAERWMDSHDVCRKLRISPRTLQTLRDNGTLAFTKIATAPTTVWKSGTGHCGCGRETERGEMERQKHLAVEVSIKDKPYE